jgi:hypothetical protein
MIKYDHRIKVIAKQAIYGCLSSFAFVYASCTGSNECFLGLQIWSLSGLSCMGVRELEVQHNTALGC